MRNWAISPQAEPQIDILELLEYAKSKNVRLLIWAHSLDVKTFGVDKAIGYFASLGFAGVKIDFINSQSQESVQWCENVVSTAALYHLLIDFHGTYKPTGMARTYPNFITQEGVLGNEYNKLGGNQVTATHTATLPFTRAILGPMDFTPAFPEPRAEGFLRPPARPGGGTRRASWPRRGVSEPAADTVRQSKNYRGQPESSSFAICPRFGMKRRALGRSGQVYRGRPPLGPALVSCRDEWRRRSSFKPL